MKLLIAPYNTYKTSSFQETCINEQEFSFIPTLSPAAGAL